jgi:tetratricopeptide (TPR) repeat protein
MGHARRATELRPDFAAAYLLWGRSLKFLGEPSAAVAPLRKGVACNPADFQLQFSLAEVLLEAEQDKEAQTYFENALRLDPNHALTVQALERLRQKKR